MLGPELSIPYAMFMQNFVLGLGTKSAEYLDMTSGGVFVHCTVEEGKLVLDRILLVTPLEDLQFKAPLISEDELIITLQPAVASPSTRVVPCEVAPAMVGPESAAASSGSRSIHAASGSIHSRRWWPRGQHNKVSTETLTHLSSSSSLFFYPNLDLCASLTLVPLMGIIHRLGARTSGLQT
jgi:hypothetical protein